MSKFKYDGHVRPMTWDDLRPGYVVRHVDFEDFPVTAISAWSDCMIVDVSSEGPHGTTWVKLARPYMYADGKGTICRKWMMGVEEFKVEGSRLIGSEAKYRIVLLSTGVPVHMEQ